VNKRPDGKELAVKVEKSALAGVFLCGALLFVIIQESGTAKAQSAADGKSDITAIDVSLAPDATMMKHASAVNARLLKVFPKGYALDATHRPHITLVQRFVRRADLDKVFDAVGRVIEQSNVTGMKLEAFKYYYAPGGALGVAGICARPTPEILKLQADVIAAVSPFVVETGPITAFTAPQASAALNAELIRYVTTFVPKMTGENFNPHVSVGVATREYLDKMDAEPFTPFTFSPVGANVYHLGPYGTAAKELKEWRPKS
jgi:hypothetical protein